MRDFLDFLMPLEGFVEVRSIKDGKIKQWFDVNRQAASDLAMQRSDDGWDAYYGVLPRTTGTHGDAAHTSNESTVLWADLDAKTIGSKQQALMSLVRYQIAPSVVVDSGHGYHAYWKLALPVSFEKARLAMIGIARDLEGDHVYDQPRILRIPGTVNYKEKDVPVPVRTVVFNTTNVLRFGDFHEQVEHGVADQAPPERPNTTRRYTNLSRNELPRWLNDLIHDGAEQGTRSEQCWKVMIKLAEAGWSDGDIRDAFDTGGIGEKMREMRNGDRWFEHSLAKARTQAR
jgi:hypothetical protein